MNKRQKYDKKLARKYMSAEERRAEKRRKRRVLVCVFFACIALINLGVSVATALQERSIQVAAEAGLTAVTLVSVVDGDTLRVKCEGEEIKVRLIGIDTPESVHADSSKNTAEGVTASDYTKALLDGVTTLYLEYDEDPTDKYGRTLAYVWLAPDTSDTGNMLNAILVADGYAIDVVYEPNHRYADLFAELSAEAAAEGRGLWPTGIFD